MEYDDGFRNKYKILWNLMNTDYVATLEYYFLPVKMTS